MKPLDGYLRHLAVERGLSKNTISAYRGDLLRYQSFLDSLSATPISVSSNQLADFPAHLVTLELRASSSARILAAVRGFHKFLILENLRPDDPTAKLRPPRLGKRLPKSLSQEQVLALLKASGPEPDEETTDLIRLRDRAILELMYSTGTRVSEVVDLDLDEVNDSGLLRVRGKGSKERIVPIGSFASRSLNAYLVRARPTFASLRGEPALFLNKRGGRLSRQSIWEIIQNTHLGIPLPRT